MEHKYIPAEGPIGAKIMLVGESPSFDEVEAGRPFVGPSGKELNNLLKDAGINRSSCWVSNVCKYFVPPVPKESKKKIPFPVRAKEHGINWDACLEELQNEINAIKPNVVVGLGATALFALTGKNIYKDDNARKKKYGIQSYRGSIMRGMGRKCVNTYHPAHLLHQAAGDFKGYWNRFLMVFDLRRAKKQSEFPDIRVPIRLITICRNSAQLYSFLQKYKNYKNPAIDIEAGGTCLPVCVSIAFTPYEGLTVPLWPNEVVNIPDADMAVIWKMLAIFLAEQEIVGQNFKYDQDKLRRLGFVIKKLASDTMLKAFAINPELPKSLALNTSIYTEEPFYKDEGMYEGKLEDLFLGGGRDACVTKEVDMNMDSDLDELGMRPFYENFLMELHDLYLDIENEGFMIDYKTRDVLFEKYIKWSEQLAYELFCIAGDNINVNSWQQVGKLLFENWKLPPRAGTGEEELTALLNIQGKTGVHDPAMRRGIEIILEKRRVDKTINNYLLALPDFDGKMKTTYYLCLETGRTSTGQLDPPIRPNIIVKGEDGKPKKKAIGTAFQTLTKHGDIGPDIRSQYIAENEHIFVQVDSAQAEARIVFLLANDEQALVDIDTHDYHALTASWFFGGTEDDHSKRKNGFETPIRFAGKTLRHAGHLGAGKRRAATEVNTQARKYKVAISINEFTAEQALRIFHLKQPKIQQVFQKGVIDCLNFHKRYLVAGLPYGIDAPSGGKRQFFERWGEELFRQAFSYIPQRSVSDNTKCAALRLRRKQRNYKHSPYRLLVESHDSLLYMVPERELNEFVPLIKEEMEMPIKFEACSLPRRDLIIPCEIETGYTYQHLSKFKFEVPIKQKDIKPRQELIIPQRKPTPNELFEVVDIPEDTRLDYLRYKES